MYYAYLKALRQYCFAHRASVIVCRRHLSASVTPRRNVTHQGAARGGPVVLRPVRATPFSYMYVTEYQNNNTGYTI